MIQAPPPAFASRENAAEIAENYWMALLRDVPFTDYPSNPIAAAAAADLNLFGADFKGAKNDQGQVTPESAVSRFDRRRQSRSGNVAILVSALLFRR